MIDDLENIILDKKKFVEIVKDLVSKNDMTHIEAIVHISEVRDVDPEELAKFVSGSIKEKIEAEAMELNLIQRRNALPFDTLFQ